ncbi:hypothetical protein ACPA9J_14685 [Pseudomonas aeruginosa]
MIDAIIGFSVVYKGPLDTLGAFQRWFAIASPIPAQQRLIFEPASMASV